MRLRHLGLVCLFLLAGCAHASGGSAPSPTPRVRHGFVAATAHCATQWCVNADGRTFRSPDNIQLVQSGTLLIAFRSHADQQQAIALGTMGGADGEGHVGTFDVLCSRRDKSGAPMPLQVGDTIKTWSRTQNLDVDGCIFAHVAPVEESIEPSAAAHLADVQKPAPAVLVRKQGDAPHEGDQYELHRSDGVLRAESLLAKCNVSGDDDRATAAFAQCDLEGKSHRLSQVFAGVKKAIYDRQIVALRRDFEHPEPASSSPLPQGQAAPQVPSTATFAIHTPETVRVSNQWRRVAWATAGVSGLALATFSAFGIWAWRLNHKLHNACDADKVCPDDDERRRLQRDGRTYALVADVALGTSLVTGVAATAFFRISGDSKAPQVTGQCSEQGCSATLRGRF